jgi:hypothetical protein
MKLHELLDRYAAMTKRERMRFLARLLVESTMAGRDTYIAGTDDVADAPRLRALNEFQHRLATHLRNIVSGVRDRYPDEVICQIILQSAQELQLRELIQCALSEADTAPAAKASRTRRALSSH